MPSTSAVSTISLLRARPSDDPLRQSLNLANTLEVLGWSQALGYSEAALRLAVAEVGPELEDVCSHLGLPSPAGPVPGKRWH